MTKQPILTALLATALLSACEELSLSPNLLETGTPVPVQFTVGPAASDLSGATLTVTGTGIPEALVFKLTDPASTTTTTTLAIPAGPNRSFVARGFTGHVETHKDQVDADVTSAGLTLQFDLKKLTGTGTMETSVEEFKVEVDDATTFTAAATSQSAAAGATLNYTVKVTYLNASAKTGGHAAGDAVTEVGVSWASSNPGVVAVGSTSCTTGTIATTPGQCSITATVNASATVGQTADVVATYKGVAHKVTVTVS